MVAYIANIQIRGCLMIDRTTKLLLAAVAVGLFFNAAVPLIQPTKVMAEEIQRGPRGRGNVPGNVQLQEEPRELNSGTQALKDEANAKAKLAICA